MALRSLRPNSHSGQAYARDTQPLALRLDLFVPDSAGPKPLVVYLTGGGFVMCRKETAADRRRYVAEAGYAVASVEYRTVLHSATYPDTVADVKSALRFLRAHTGEYGFDAERIAVWGESAGGYLAAMAGATNGRAEFETGDNPDYSSAVQAVIDLFGPSNLAKVADDFDPAARQARLKPGTSSAAFVFGKGTNKSLADDPAAIAAADPATYITAAAPPFLLLHGSADSLLSPSQTLLVHDALRAHGVESTRYVLDGAGHGDMAVMLGDPQAALPWSTTQAMGYLTDFLDKHLRA